MLAVISIEGQQFILLNGGPQFGFSQAISFVVNCKTQAEIDRLWEELSEGGETQACGWLRDRFGVSWQIVPANLNELVGGKNTAGAQRAMAALLQMTKLDIKELKRAHNQK
jgi:predicted 3-demethylubiquinone-9 3-methyltransferase (glyoxalase superfamily)